MFKAFQYSQKKLTQIALPMGGIGAGSICLNGHGGLQDFSIRNRPAIGPLPDRFGNGRDAGFGILHIKGKNPATKLVEGPFPTERIYNMGLHGVGHLQGRYEGLPRFKKNSFEAAYPFGCVNLSDPSIPLAVSITGWSPMIPRDDIASGIPAAMLEYRFQNHSNRTVEFDFIYNLTHLVPDSAHGEKGMRNAAIPGKGVFFTNTDAVDSEKFGSASVTVIGQSPKIKAMWLRGGWLDGLSSLWREIETEEFEANSGKSGEGMDGRNGGSILVQHKLSPNEEVVIPVVITWYFPNCRYDVGLVKPEDQKDIPARWSPFYTSQWNDAKEVALFVHKNYSKLRERTLAFSEALLSSTLPREVLDAISANLAILKSPTILRQKNGNLWGWEGCFTDEGCCHGSCTHVWNYAQTIPHLFPKLERTLREQELLRSMDDRGHVNFRAALPDGPTTHDFHAAADGQLGGIMKLWRDWHISGDSQWMKELYPLARKSIEYCINQWDPSNRGVLVEPHHNTYDIEFWGPDGMCTSVYIGALSAMREMALANDQPEDAERYQKLAESGARFMDQELFNGEYYEQKVEFRELKDQSFVESISGKKSPLPPSMLKILRKEGPKYQYGTGCLADGIIGAWMAGIYGISIPLEVKNVRSSIASIFRHNFRSNLREHCNPQRPGYAIGEEPGLLICSWPKGGKPTLPFPYSDEVMTGMEYQVATHLISEGFVKEGVQIVKATRSRHDGSVRNPFNEYECGNYYARAMASFALLQAFSGFHYSKRNKVLKFGPRLKQRPFQSFFATADAHGTITLKENLLQIEVIEGELDVKQIELEPKPGSKSVICQVDTIVRAGKKFVLPFPVSKSARGRKS
jgi:uncharacterized protein (DUF608 family)